MFIDETGEAHGYSVKGKSLEAQKLVVKGEHVSTIAAMSMQRIISLKIVQGGVNGDVFYDFICQLLPCTVEALQWYQSTQVY